ncbi:MAG TPA: hypothetical protein VL357_12400 [Rariglobus sp.]|jgi:hypothetical protein|nr:hypothetical protein [Rariglobus sp.]
MASSSAPLSTSAETTRSEHLRHETTILMVGMLYYVAAGMMMAAAVASLVLKNGTEAAVRFASLMGLLAAGYGFAGYLLRRLDARARYAASMMAVLGMLAVPIGTVFNAYVLWLVHNKKGRTVLSPEYRQVIAETPQIQCRVINSVLALGIVMVGIAIYRILEMFLR